MPVFRYTALTASGESISGDVEAAGKDAALEHVQRQNLIPIDIKNESTAPWWSWNIEDLLGPSFSLKELKLFSSQLARLLKSGLELDRAIRLLAELAENKRWHGIILRIEENIRRGKSLSEAMTNEGNVFPGDYVSMIRAGESSGMLGPTIDRLAALLQRRVKITQRVLSALIYPAILLVVAIGSVVIMLTFVLPQFEPLFADTNVTMPLPTRIVISLSDFVQDYWWLWIAFLIAAIALWKYIKRSPSHLLNRDRFLLKIRLIGPLLLHADIARLTRTLGTLLQNGGTLGTGLSIAGEGLKNTHLRAAVDATTVALREGEGLATPLTKTGCFPKLMLNMIQIGEESGRLEEMLLEISDIYEEEMQQSIDRMMVLLVPIITIGMGLIVAFIVASMLLAMLSINNLAL